MVQVNSAWNVGDYDGAYRSSANARKWSIASIVVGTVIFIIFVLLNIVSSAQATTNASEG